MAQLYRQTRWCAGLFLVCLSFAGSVAAHMPFGRQPIAQTWVSSKPIAAVEKCVVKALDENRRTYSRISPSVRHVAKVMDANSVVDIRPSRDHVLADTDYHVRLEKIHEHITRIALYTDYPGAKDDTTDSGQKQKSTAATDQKKEPAIEVGKDIAQAIARCP